ncbi:SURF1 family protein [Trichuris suis]|nr:SURF1 family protein [Trichuris suis]
MFACRRDITAMRTPYLSFTSSRRMSRKFSFNPASLKPKREIKAGGFALLVFPVGFFLLGCWQVKRRIWKKKLLQQLEERVCGDPVDLPDDLRALSDMEFSRIRVRGYFDHEDEFVIPMRARRDSTFLQRRNHFMFDESSPVGANVITPFRVKDRGYKILINRGWVPNQMVDPKTRLKGQIEGEVEVIGINRLNEKRPPFVMKNDPVRNMWFYRDVNAMAAFHDTAPVYLEADAGGHCAQSRRICGQRCFSFNELWICDERTYSLVRKCTRCARSATCCQTFEMAFSIEDRLELDRQVAYFSTQQEVVEFAKRLVAIADEIDELYGNGEKSIANYPKRFNADSFLVKSFASCSIECRIRAARQLLAIVYSRRALIHILLCSSFRCGELSTTTAENFVQPSCVKTRKRSIDLTMFRWPLSLLANFILVLTAKCSYSGYSSFDQNPALVSPGGSHCCVMIATGCCPQTSFDKVTCFGPGGIPMQIVQPGGTVGTIGGYPGVQPPTQPSGGIYPGGVYTAGVSTGTVGGGITGGVYPSGVTTGTVGTGVAGGVFPTGVSTGTAGTSVAGGVYPGGVSTGTVGTGIAGGTSVAGGVYPSGVSTGTVGTGIAAGVYPGGVSTGVHGTGIAGGIGVPSVQPTAPISPGSTAVYPSGVPQQPTTYLPGISWPGAQIPPAEQTQRCNDILREICRYCQQWNILGTLQGQQIPSMGYSQPATMHSPLQQQVNIGGGQQVVLPGQQDHGTQPLMTNVDIKVPLLPSNGGMLVPQANALPSVQENPWTVQVPLSWDGTVAQDLPNAQALSLLQETNPASFGLPLVNYKNQLKTDDPVAIDNQQIDDAIRNMNEARLARQVARRWEIMTRMRAQAAARATAKYRYHSAGAAKTERIELTRLNNSQSAYIPKITLRQQEVNNPLP